MNDKQLEFIAYTIALASDLSYDKRVNFKNEIIRKYKKLEDNEECLND